MTWVELEVPPWVRDAFGSGRDLGTIALSAGPTLHVRDAVGIGYDVVVGSDEDPSVVGVRSINELLRQLGIEWRLRLVHVRPVTDRLGDREEPRFYTLGARVFRHQDDDLVTVERDVDGDVERENDVVVAGPDVPLVAAQEQLPHESSPCSMCGASSVGEPPVAGDASGSPAAGEGVSQ